VDAGELVTATERTVVPVGVGVVGAAGLLDLLLSHAALIAIVSAIESHMIGRFMDLAPPFNRRGG